MKDTQCSASLTMKRGCHLPVALRAPSADPPLWGQGLSTALESDRPSVTSHFRRGFPQGQLSQVRERGTGQLRPLRARDNNERGRQVKAERR